MYFPVCHGDLDVRPLIDVNCCVAVKMVDDQLGRPQNIYVLACLYYSFSVSCWYVPAPYAEEMREHSHGALLEPIYTTEHRSMPASKGVEKNNYTNYSIDIGSFQALSLS